MKRVWLGAALLVMIGLPAFGQRRNRTALQMLEV